MEIRLVQAVEYKEKNPRAKLVVVASKFQVTYHLLRSRLAGVPPATSKGGHNANLTPDQNKALKAYIDYLIGIGHQATKKHILLGGNAIIQGAGINKRLDTQWAGRWFKRNKGYFKTIKTRSLSFERKATHNKEDILKHFVDFSDIVQRYGIDPSDMYNMDETGFRIGCLNGRIVITHVGTKGVYLVDPDNRDYITSVETIGGDGTTIPPLIILKGRVLLESYFKNNLHDDTLLATTDTGYITNELGMLWLVHFDEMTKKKQKGTFRLLIMDGQSSHITEEFVVYCWLNKIVPFLLPPHTTHLLQPLDIGVFQHLKHWHQEDIASIIQFGDIKYDKVDFLNGFEAMRKKAFKKKTIQHAWEEAGLLKSGELHVNPEKVLSKMAESFSEPTHAGPPTEPVTPPRRPFMHPPASRDRAAHSAYLDQRLQDAFDEKIPLTPSFHDSLRAWRQDIKSKLATASLIQKHDADRIEAAKEQARRKQKSGRHIQSGGVIYKRVGLQQTLAMEAKLAEARTNRDNKAEKREALAAEKEYIKAWKQVYKALPRHVDKVVDIHISRHALMAQLMPQIKGIRDVNTGHLKLKHVVDFEDYEVFYYYNTT